MFHSRAPLQYRAKLAALSVPLATLAALGFSGCLSSDGDGTSDVLATYVSEVVEIDREARTITTREAYWRCEGEVAVRDADVYTEKYRIIDGKLYRWEENYSCMSTILDGSSDDIAGTWSGNPPLIGDGPVADADWCEGSMGAERDYVNRIMRRAKLTEEISETETKVTFTGEVCSAEDFAYYISDFSLDQVEMSQEDCTSITLTNSDDVSAQVESSVTAGILNLKFVTEGATCTAALSMDDSTQPICTDGGPEQVFEDCVLESDFFGAEMLLKNGPESGAAYSAHLRKVLRNR